MDMPMTLLEIAEAPSELINWGNCSVVMIDYQNEYLSGAIQLGSAGAKAIKNAVLLLDKSRRERAPIFHVVQHGKPGGKVFDPLSEQVSILSDLQPLPDEKVLEKTHPNSFHNTMLKELLLSTGRQQVIFAGFMSHMCVSSSVRASLDLGFKNFVCHDACATRTITNQKGEIVSAELLHDAAMAALRDRFATMVSIKELVS